MKGDKELPYNLSAYIVVHAFFNFLSLGIGYEINIAGISAPPNIRVSQTPYQQQVDDTCTRKPVSDIFVIALTGNELNRCSFENKFVAHLKSVGAVAIASEEATLMPTDQIMNDLISAVSE